MADDTEQEGKLVSLTSTIEFDDETGEVKITSAEEPQEVVVAEDEPEEEQEVPEVPVVKEEQPKVVEKPSRARERIAALANENRALKQQNEAEKKRLSDITSTFAKRMTDSLTKEIASLREQRAQALTEGDNQKLAQIEDALDVAREELRQYSSFTEAAEPQKEVQKQEGGIPEAALDWSIGKEYLVNNNDYLSLPKEKRVKLSPLRSAVRALVPELTQEGFDVNDPTFYEELDIRLAAKFDFYDALANEGISVLDSNSETSSGETVKPQVKTEKSKSIPVKSPSPSNSVSKHTGKQVRISKDEYSFWKRHLEHEGVTLEQYAEEKRKREGLKG